ACVGKYLDSAVERVDDIELSLAPHDAARSLELPFFGPAASELQKEIPLLVEFLHAIVPAVLADIEILVVVFDDGDRIDELSRFGSLASEHRQDIPILIEEHGAMIVRVGHPRPPVPELENLLGTSCRVLRHPPLPEQPPVAIVNQDTS